MNSLAILIISNNMAGRIKFSRKFITIELFSLFFWLLFEMPILSAFYKYVEEHITVQIKRGVFRENLKVWKLKNQPLNIFFFQLNNTID